jgi:long-chain acyl-CoA synthetase
VFINDRVYKLNENLLIDEDGKCFTYSDLLTFNESLSKLNLVRELVFCICDNSIELIFGYISFISNKIVPLMLDSNLDHSMLINLLKRYKPRYLWIPSQLFCNFSSKVILFKYKNYLLIDYNKNSKSILNDELALLLTTSGSTGSPKLVRISYENILSNAKSIAEYLLIDKNDRPITSLPINYSFGLSIINSHLIKGATILVTNRSIMEREFWSFCKGQKATFLAGVPYTFEMLKKLRFSRMDLPFLTTITQAGGKLNPELIKEYTEYCEKTNKRFVVMYGQTEATARMSYLPSNMTLKKTNSIGIAIPKGNFSIVSEEGNLVEESETIGELVYEGPNVSLGYAECREDLSKGDVNNGKLFTGDLAKRDSDGYFYIVGRKKRFIKLFGNRINLDEIEIMLKSLIPESACTGIDDKMDVYITEEGRENEVKNFLSKKTGINHSAFHVKHIESIPKNSSGKTIYTKFEN